MPIDKPSAREVLIHEKLEEDFAQGKFDPELFEMLRNGLPGRRIFEITNQYLQLFKNGFHVIQPAEWVETFGINQVADAYHLACRLVHIEKTDELLELYLRERRRSFQLTKELGQQPAPPSEAHE